MRAGDEVRLVRYDDAAPAEGVTTPVQLQRRG
jgi:hypothetical protein